MATHSSGETGSPEPNRPKDPPPAWRMPRGVDSPLWHYTQDARLADEDDTYFHGHPLHEADLAWVEQRLPPGSAVADLGCGTGRVAIPLAGAGHRVVGVDLAHAMLAKMVHDASARNVVVHAVEANLCDLSALRTHGFDAALLLFSTLGMIRGRAERQGVLRHASRVVRPGGQLLLHAHNLWHNLASPGGRSWLLPRLLQALRNAESVGDRPMMYRKIPNLVVHQYQYREIRHDLEQAGWQVTSSVPIDAVLARPLARRPGPLTLACGGWFIEATH